MSTNYSDEVRVLLGPSVISSGIEGAHLMRKNLLDTIDVSLTNFLLQWWHFLVCRTTEPFPKQHNIKKRYTSSNTAVDR